MLHVYTFCEPPCTPNKSTAVSALTERNCDMEGYMELLMWKSIIKEIGKGILSWISYHTSWTTYSKVPFYTTHEKTELTIPHRNDFALHCLNIITDKRCFATHGNVQFPDNCSHSSRQLIKWRIFTWHFSPQRATYCFWKKLWFFVKEAFNCLQNSVQNLKSKLWYIIKDDLIQLQLSLQYLPLFSIIQWSN